MRSCCLHTRSGLIPEIEASTLSLADAGAQTLEYIRQSVWAGTADDVTRAIERYRPAGLDGFIAQVYPPYDEETIEQLATTVRERIGDPAPAGKGN